MIWLMSQKLLLLMSVSSFHVDPSSLKLYGNRPKTRTEHLQEIQMHLGFHTASQMELEILSRWLLERALEHDKPSLLLQLVCEKLYQEKNCQTPALPDWKRWSQRLDLKHRKKRSNGYLQLLTPEYKALLDNLLWWVTRQRTAPVTPGWIKAATSNTASAMLFCLDKLVFLREHNVDKWDMSFLTPNRLKVFGTNCKTVN